MRDSSFDIMKGIAILLVVLGHSVPDQASASGIASYPLYLMRTIIYSFHMPVFFFVAGYFMHIPLKEGFNKFVKDKFIRLMVPYFTIGLLYFPFKLALSKFANQQIMYRIYGKFLLVLTLMENFGFYIVCSLFPFLRGC